MTGRAAADKAKADAGFRSPNQKPVAKTVPATGHPSTPAAHALVQPLATTFPGPSQTNYDTPDTIMAAGPSNIVVAVNAEVAVYTKAGTQVGIPQQLSDLFKAVRPANDFVFDPYVVYDPYIQRFWLIADSTHDKDANDNQNRSTILIALSNGSDATSGWTTHAIDATVNGSTSTDNWCDQSFIGFDTQAIYITCNMFAFPTKSENFKDSKIRVMTKGQFRSGPCCEWWDFYNLSEGSFGLDTPQSIRPAQMLGATDTDGEYLADAHGQGGSDDTLEVWHITDPGNCCGANPSAPTLDSNGRPVGSFDPPPDARQKGTSATLETRGTRLRYLFWQYGHLSTGQHLACPSAHAACVSYTEVDVRRFPDMSVVNDFVLAQDASIDRIYPAVAPNAAGDKTMVFSESGPNQFAGTSIVFIPRSSTCTNCANNEISIASGLSPHGGSGQQRWGDYSGASADPDGDGVWVAGEFAATGGAWGTQVALTMDRTPTAITYTGPLGADANATVQLSANLVLATNGSPLPLANAPIAFSVGTQFCTATTDANGHAVCPVTLNQPNGTVDVQAQYLGGADFGPSSTTQSFTIGTAGRSAAALTYTGDTTGEFQATANLAATLVETKAGNPVVARPITFTLGAQACTATTDATGLAQCSVVLQQRPGTYTVTADFPGDAAFGPATSSASFTITKGRTITTVVSSKNPSDFGQPVTFTATVAAANPGAVSPSGQVRFQRSTIGLGTGGLDALGHTALTVPILQVGQNPITATYGGDDFFLDSTGSLTQTVGCTRTVTGTQPGGLKLTAGSTCITNATVNGAITISAGAAVSISNSQLNGSVTATSALALTICGSTVKGSVGVTGTAKYVLVGDGGDDGMPACAGNTFSGSVLIAGSKGQMEFGGNTVTGSVVLNDSSGTGPDEETTTSEIEANTIGGSLSCTGNTPPPTNDGHPNKLTGPAAGQCTGL